MSNLMIFRYRSVSVYIYTHPLPPSLRPARRTTSAGEDYGRRALIPPLTQHLILLCNIRMRERGRVFLRGGFRPLSFLTPLSNHNSFSIHLNGSGWRGARGEVSVTNQYRTIPSTRRISCLILSLSETLKYTS
jgi:hypothetical protein